MSISTCENHDYVIVYEGLVCPACVEFANLKDEIKELKSQIEDLEVTE